ncbi:MAG TPA: hypothetical protein VFV87_03055 [Pirellulaceae bacterium]|nr:hypothetical protein [Pirellulaceae bacterium]
MIVLPQHRTLILTPGKCGSTSLHEAFPLQLIGPQGPWRRLGHFNFRDSIGKHTMLVPYDLRDYAVLIVVRHADSYVRSLWQHWQRHCERLDFETFLAKRCEWRERCEPGPWFYWWDVADYLAEAPRRRDLVPLAELNETIERLTGVKLGRLNRSPGVDPQR